MKQKGYSAVVSLVVELEISQCKYIFCSDLWGVNHAIFLHHSLPYTTGKASWCSNLHCWVGYWHSATICDSDITTQWILCKYLRKCRVDCSSLTHLQFSTILHHSFLIWD